MKVKDIAKINEKSINKKYRGRMEYLDTKSVTDNAFGHYIKYRGIKTAPSRARRVARIGDTIISTVRPNQRHIGFISSQPSNAIYSTGFAVVSPDTDQIDPYYLYLFLSSKDVTELLQQIGETSTSAYPSVRPSDIGNLDINVPSRDVQNEVSNRISLLDRKIHLNNQINDNLLELARELYRKVLSSSSLTETKLKDFATVTMGQSPSSKTYNDNKVGIALLNGAADFRNGVHPSKWTTDPKRIVDAGTYIFGVRATIGLITKVFDKYAIGRGTGSAIPNDPVNDELLYFVLEDMFKYFENSASGSVYINISKSDFTNYVFYCPQVNAQQAFHQTAGPIMNKIYSNNRENLVLTQIKETLLNQFF